MGAFRFFVQEELLFIGQKIVLVGGESHHLKDVFRVQPGECVELVNGLGYLARARVTSINKKESILSVVEYEKIEGSRYKVFLCLANLRPSHLSYALEKGVEVGVDSFIIFSADRSELKNISESKIQRLESLIIAAVKQSGRVMRPEIHVVQNVEQALNMSPKQKFWADLNFDSRNLSERLQQNLSKSDTAVFIGPESGWSDRERKILEQEGEPVLLHPNILRAETAAIVASYEISSWLNEREMA